MSETISPPQSLETEAAVLACFFIYPADAAALCATRRVSGDYFFLPANIKVFNAFMAIWERGGSADFSTVAAELGPLLESIGGAGRLCELIATDCMPSALNDYLDILHDRFLLRKIRECCVSTRTRTLDHGNRGADVLAGLLGALAPLSQGGLKKPPTMKQLVMDKFNRMERNENDANILKTGFTKLDVYSPLKRGSMPLITGERKAGKSMFSLNLAGNLAKAGNRVQYFTLEEPAADVIDRLYARQSGIPIILHDNRSLGEDKMPALQESARVLAALPMSIRDDVFDLTQIVGAVRQYHAEHPDLAAVFVDYAQLVRVSLAKGTNREQEVAHVSRTLRLLALELKVALLLLCQLNKEGESRESKALEQDCTAMWKLDKPDPGKPNERTLYIPFQRGGEGNVGMNFAFHGHLCRFADGAAEPTP